MSDRAAARFVQDQLCALLVANSSALALLYQEQWSTWGELASVANDLEERLEQLDVPQRGRVALVLRNRPSGLAALLGLLAAGRVPALVSPIQPPNSIAAAVEALSPVALVVDPEDYSDELAAVALRSECAGLTLSTSVEVRYAPNVIPREGDRLVGDDVAMIVPTSGTAGPPKPIPMFWEQLPFDASRGIRTPLPSDMRPPIIHALSMATITGVMGVLRASARGRAMALLERVDVDEWSRLVVRFQLRVAGLPPAAMRTMLDAGIPPERLASLEAWQTGSAPLTPELQREFETTFDVPVLVAYGATEFGGAVSAWTLNMHREWSERKLGSVGRSVDGVELRITDQDSDEPLPAGRIGILSVRVPGAAGADSDGWLRTNDLARIDDDRFLFIHGRADDVIIRGGFKVSLGELEALVREHPGVRDVAAVGLEEPRLGEVPAVAVILEQGAMVTPDGLRTWVRERTAPYKVPTLVVVLDALPMGSSHKVNRAAVREILRQSVPAVIEA